MSAFSLAKARVVAAVDNVEEVLGIGELGLTVHHSFNESPLSGDDEARTVAETKADWQYRQVKFRWYLPAIVALTDEQLIEDVVHEYVHAVLDPMESEVPEKFAKQCEFAVESMARVVLHAWKAGA